MLVTVVAAILILLVAICIALAVIGLLYSVIAKRNLVSLVVLILLVCLLARIWKAI